MNSCPGNWRAPHSAHRDDLYSVLAWNRSVCCIESRDVCGQHIPIGAVHHRRCAYRSESNRRIKKVLQTLDNAPGSSLRFSSAESIHAYFVRLGSEFQVRFHPS